MAGVSKQKQKLLIMEQMFDRQTDIDHPITGNQLIEILKNMDIKAERKTIYDDIATLCDAGLGIETTKRGHSNAYYKAQRLFDDEELKILANMCASSKYLTIKRANELIRKLQTLTSEHKAAGLKRTIYVANRTKSSNDGVFGVVDVISEAIANDREVEMIYSDENDRKKGEKIVISPYHIVCEGDDYYIICVCGGEILRLKAERMSSPSLGNEGRYSLSDEEDKLVKAYRELPENAGQAG